LTTRPAPDELEDELSRFDAKVLQTSLSNEDQAKLWATLGAEEKIEA
jgi:uncharacterized membrane protein